MKLTYFYNSNKIVNVSGPGELFVAAKAGYIFICQSEKPFVKVLAKIPATFFVNFSKKLFSAFLNFSKFENFQVRCSVTDEGYLIGNQVTRSQYIIRIQCDLSGTPGLDISEAQFFGLLKGILDCMLCTNGYDLHYVVKILKVTID